jgi:hypothetical protein
VGQSRRGSSVITVVREMEATGEAESACNGQNEAFWRVERLRGRFCADVVPIKATQIL